MFDSDFLKKLEYLALVSQRPFVAESAAGHRNAKLGGGVEFASYRDYVPGDDLRRLDWNVYARLGSKRIKRFQDVGDLSIYCCLDISESMRGDETGAKLDCAKNILAALAYLSLSRGDVVSVLPFSDRVGAMLPPIRGKERFLTALKFIRSLNVIGGTTDFVAAFSEMTRKIKKPGMAIIVSDCYSAPAKSSSGANHLAEALETLIYRRFEPMVIQLSTPEEESPRLLGDYRLIDRETGTLRTVTMNESTLKIYRGCFRRFVDSIRYECLKRHCRHFAASTQTPFEETVLAVTRNAEERT